MRFPARIAVCLASIAPLGPIEASPKPDSLVAAVEERLPELDFSAGVPWTGLGAHPGSTRIEARMSAYGVPGVSLALIEGGEIAWAAAYGVLSAEESTRVDPGTPFEAASTTKFVTALVVLELASRGELDLDADVNRGLRSWRIPDGEWTLKEKVTARRLLRHTAGTNRPDGGFSVTGSGIPTLGQVLSGAAPASNPPLTIEFEPGSRHQYSNFGYLVLQQLLEDGRGRPFPGIVEEVLLGPLGLSDSGFDPETLRPSGALPRHHDPQGRPLASSGHPVALAQGGLWSTPSDLARITVEVLRALRDAPGTALRPETARRLLEDPLAIDPAENMGFPYEGTGCFLLPCRVGFVLSHPGFNAPGATCLLIAFPQTGQGAVVMTNGANGLQLSLEILSAASAAYRWPRIGPPSGG